MPSRSNSLAWLYPTVVWLILLVTLFATEYLVMLILPLLVPKEPNRLLEAFVDAVILTVVLAPLMWWMIVRPLREINRMRAQYLADLFAQIEIDRRRIAHELHDGVGQLLTLLISGLRSADRDRINEGSTSRTQAFQRLAEEALQDVRRLSMGLRPSLLDDLGLVPAIERLAEDMRTHHSIQLALDLYQDPDHPLEERIATALFRIVQEALSNIIKHSHAEHASISLHQTEEEVKVMIKDDGCGIDPIRLRSPLPGHLGLAGMRERATLLGGDLVIDSAPQQGTRIVATIPVIGPHHG